MALYVPNSIDINNVVCVNVLENDVVYLTLNNGSNYKLIYNNLLRDYTLESLSSLDVSCQDITLSHDLYYRKDINDILLVFLILVIICFYFPYRIISRCFGRWLKL